MTVLSAQRLAEVFVEVADTLADDFDVIEFLHTVTGRTAELVEGTAVGLLLGDPAGRLQFMAASDEASWMLKLFEIQKYEGPSLEAFRTGEPVTYLDLRETNDRWPVFGPRAVALGFSSAHAIPMRLRGQVIGALNLLGHEPIVIGAADQAVVQALVDVATIGLLQERQIRRSAGFADQLQAAMDSRTAIEQAKGHLAQAHGVSVDEALGMLVSYARSHGQRLNELAAAIVSRGQAGVAELAETGLHPKSSDPVT